MQYTDRETIGRRNVILIQTNYRGYYVRANMGAYREACERAKLFREAAVLYLQAFWRKRMAIEYVRGLQVAHRSLCEYAVKIQMAWRRHTVGGWRHIRYARTVRAIRTQYRLDMLEVRRDVLQKEWKRLDEQGRDSASEDDEAREAGLVEDVVRDYAVSAVTTCRMWTIDRAVLDPFEKHHRIQIGIFMTHESN